MTKRIIYTNTDGGVSIVVPAPNSGLAVDEVAAKDVPNGVTFDIVDTSTIPSERTFRTAWVKNGNAVQTDMLAAKEIAHGMRRSARDEEMKPYDDIISKQIPGTDAVQAEASRAFLRTKYAVIQTDIDGSVSELELLAALGRMN